LAHSLSAISFTPHHTLSRNKKKNAMPEPLPLTPSTGLLFLPLGGIGEIGMNVYLYGLERGDGDRQWLMVDLGITFPSAAEPGVDVVFPDLRFIEEERGSLAGILLTHAHEDHFGAIADLWPKLQVPVYATKFAAALLKRKLEEFSYRNEVRIVEVAQDSRFTIGPFDIELATVAHSIPECNAVFIRNAAGNILHTGDWKLDAEPGLGQPTDENKLRAFGEEGVHVLVCDSTNALLEGMSASEGQVARTLTSLIARSGGRVAVTTFASNVARLIAVGEAAKATGRELVIVGRAMHRIAEVARDTGLWPSHMTFMDQDYFGTLPRDKVVALVTGSQGEQRAALNRIAEGDHPFVKLERGDSMIFSARAIPGNEEAVIRIINLLADRGVKVITDVPEGPVHASGHPRRGELAKLYQWTRARFFVPMHGEPRHLEEHSAFAEKHGLHAVRGVRNGKLLKLGPGVPEIIDTVPVGRLYRDGRLLLEDDTPIRQRRKLAWVGTVTVSLALSRSGELAADPQISMFGLPEEDENGLDMGERVLNAVHGAFDSIPRPRRKDANLIGDAVQRAIRAEVNAAWGKKPLCSVLVSLV
jgi:ribonuclease J